MTTNATLSLHAGGWTATEEDVNAVPVPQATWSYSPVPHNRVIEQLRNLLPKHGMKIDRMQLGLGAKGNRLFGVCDVSNGAGRPDWTIAIGFRNSYDKSMRLSLCGGTRVFVCDNLAFSADVMLRELHVRNIDARLPGLVDSLILGVVGFKDKIAAQVDRFKATDLDDRSAHDVVCRSLTRGVINTTDVLDILKEYHEPRHEEFGPRNAWSLYNAYTQVAKDKSAGRQMQSTLALTAMFNAEFAAK